MLRTYLMLGIGAFLGMAGPASGQAAVASWRELVDRAAQDASAAAACARLFEKADEVAAKPIVRRAYSIDTIDTSRSFLDGRSAALEDEIRETFALAMSDFGACGRIAEELPLLAATYRVQRAPGMLKRIVAQLEEVASWSPLQRPGWTLYTPGHRLPPDGKDGNWLATGLGVRAIGDALELLPDGAIEPALVARLHALLEVEVASIAEDWRVARPWFVRGNNPITNQWVLPTEGLVRACLILGADAHRDAYELGVKNLLAALDAHGSRGEFEEGFGYASFTLTSALHAAHAMAVAGDRRAIDRPFLANFPTWLVQHFQPGRMVINCFDAGAAFAREEQSRPLLSLLAVCTSAKTARWALAYQVGGPSDDLAGLGARALEPVGPNDAPPLFAYYERATRVNWRSSWDQDATGVWVRGGHPTDQHDHQDRGHVNFIAKGRPILIESGTPSYDHKLMMTHYTTGMGHNVLQLGLAFPDTPGDAGKLVHLPGWQNAGGVAPIDVRRLDERGGDVTVDGTKCYDGLTEWRREVSWNSAELSVRDHVLLAEGRKEFLVFRWHLGSEQAASIEPATGAPEENPPRNHYKVTWPDATIMFDASSPLTISPTPWPDNTLEGHDGSESPKNVHTCIVVQTAEEQSELTIELRFANIAENVSVRIGLEPKRSVNGTARQVSKSRERKD